MSINCIFNSLDKLIFFTIINPIQIEKVSYILGCLILQGPPVPGDGDTGIDAVSINNYVLTGLAIGVFIAKKKLTSKKTKPS